jgi:hypothetical protein
LTIKTVATLLRRSGYPQQLKAGVRRLPPMSAVSRGRLRKSNMAEYLRSSISNGNPLEQALIRRWWHANYHARGRMVWEYYFEGMYADAVWFFNAPVVAVEEPGRGAPERFLLRGTEVVLCEAKAALTPELIEQALVYTRVALRAGADVRETVIFVERGTHTMQEVAKELGFTLVVRPLDR